MVSICLCGVFQGDYFLTFNVKIMFVLHVLNFANCGCFTFTIFTVKKVYLCFAIVLKHRFILFRQYKLFILDRKIFLLCFWIDVDYFYVIIIPTVLLFDVLGV